MQTAIHLFVIWNRAENWRTRIIDDLKSNDYGFCASCGIEIGIRRLEARPTATRCIDCKTIEEIHERQQFG